MKFTFTDMLKQTVDLKRPTQSAGTTGGISTTAETTLYSSKKCSLQPINGDNVVLYGKDTVVSTHIAIFAEVLDVSAGDILVHGAKKYWITYTENQGGDDTVFALYLKQYE